METIYSNQIPSPLIYLEKYMNRLLFGFLFLASMYLPLSAQTHNSVPLDDPIYFLLETASIKGYCTLPAIRPYSQKTILKALEQIAASDDASPLERDSAQAAILRLQPPSQEAWYKTGRLNFNYDTASGLKNRLGLGVNLSAHIGSNFTKPSFTWEAILDAWVNGDFTKYFSYKLLMAAGLSDYDFDAYPPYTFSQPYDGFQFLLNPMGDFTAKSQDGHIGMKIQPELSFGFGDGMLSINFSRIRRDWQLAQGVGGLLLAGSARPFMALDIYFSPTKWLQLAFLNGVLEYNRADSDTIRPFDFQNSFTAMKAQFGLGKYVDAAINSAVVFTKRFEMGYFNPLMVPLFYQNMVGDFDNLYFGGTLVVKIPRWGRIFADILLSEIRSLDIVYTPQNVYAWQAGGQLAIPGSPTTITLQYTKIEPFMYTHYGTITPWTGDTEMNTSLVNHGEGIGSNLPPNTDELKLSATGMPLLFLEWNASYRMVRHGITPPGSTYEPTEYSDMPDRKHFLHDGVYQWQHIFTVGCSYTMQQLHIPINIFCDLGLVYSYHTDTTDASSSVIHRINTSEYPNRLSVLGKIGVKVFP